MNLRIAFPAETDNGRKRKILFDSFINAGRTFSEFVNLPRLTNDHLISHTSCPTMERLTRALGQGRGVIICGFHFANWYWCAVWLASLGFKGGVMVRPLENPLLNEMMTQALEERGVNVVPQYHIARRGRELLGRRELLGIMVDENAPRKGIFVPYFGVPASTMRAITYLHEKTGAPIICAHDERTAAGHHTVHFSDSIPAAASDETTLGAIHQYVEEAIRKNPGEYLWWTHPRWKKRPEGERSLYEGVKV